MRQVVIGLTLAAALAGAGCASRGGMMGGMGAGMGAGMGPGSQQMHGAMMGGMRQMERMPMSGDVDRDFAMMMRMHHQQAIDMARAQLQHGRSPEMKQLAEKIIQDQQREIGEIDRWLARPR